MSTHSQRRRAEDMLHAAVEQLLDDDPLTAIRQVSGFTDLAIPYLRAARRAAIYRAKTRGKGMSWPALAQALGIRENNVKAIVARHCRDTGDPWPRRAGVERRPPAGALDLRGVQR